MVETMKKPAGTRRSRLSGDDFAALREIVHTAAMLLEPGEISYRKAFESVMPDVFIMRNKGDSWAQITTVLNRGGLRLQESTIKSYFNEMLAVRQELCAARLNEQILILAELKNEGHAADLSVLKTRFDTIQSRQTAKTEKKVEAFLGETTPFVSPQKAQPVVPKPADTDTAASEFGLLKLKPREASHRAGTTSAGFFSMDDTSTTTTKSEVQQRTDAIEVSQGDAPKPKLECRPLQPGIVSLKPRDGVPPEAYQPGLLEHPSIPGLMLTLAQRLYGAQLEYTSTEDGEIHLETAKQRIFRIKWQKPIKDTISRTSHTFVEMDHSLFSGRKGSREPASRAC